MRPFSKMSRSVWRRSRLSSCGVAESCHSSRRRPERSSRSRAPSARTFWLILLALRAQGWGLPVSSYVMQMMPYALALVALAGLGRAARLPAAIGTPFRRE